MSRLVSSLVREAAEPGPAVAAPLWVALAAEPEPDVVEVGEVEPDEVEVDALRALWKKFDRLPEAPAC